MEKAKKWFKKIEKQKVIGEWKIVNFQKSQELQGIMQKGKKVVDDTLFKYTWNTLWFPFAENGAGDLICVTLDENEYTDENPFAFEEIFVWYHEENRIAVQYGDLEELLESEG